MKLLVVIACLLPSVLARLHFLGSHFHDHVGSAPTYIFTGWQFFPVARRVGIPFPGVNRYMYQSVGPARGFDGSGMFLD